MTHKHWNQCPKRSKQNTQCKTGTTNPYSRHRTNTQNYAMRNTGKPKRPSKARILLLPIIASIFFVGWIIARIDEKRERQKAAEKAENHQKDKETKET